MLHAGVASVATSPSAPLRVAISCNDLQRTAALKTALENQGLRVSAVGPIEERWLTWVGADRADVLLVDLDEEVDSDPLMMDRVLDRARLPVVFNDGTVSPELVFASTSKGGRSWGERLARKLLRVATDHAVALSSAGMQATGLLPGESGPAGTAAAGDAQERATRVWVLGASVGGPQAVKEFLRAIPRELPVAFVLGQHIGARFVGPLAEQLDKATALNVVAATAGLVLRSGQVLIAPVDQRIAIGIHGEFEFTGQGLTGSYRPSIDALIQEAACRYGDHAGAILFSGMGDDGLQGCRALVERGGIVWAQSADTCFVSSMPDHARAAGIVEFSGSPGGLARRLCQQHLA